MLGLVGEFVYVGLLDVLLIVHRHRGAVNALLHMECGSFSIWTTNLRILFPMYAHGIPYTLGRKYLYRNPFVTSKHVRFGFIEWLARGVP